MSKRRNITKLPVTLQTETLKKFFESTVDQLLFKRDSEKLDGFVGRRVGGFYDVNEDFYIGEKTKNRTNYQLEPSALTKDPDTFEDENIVLYQDLLNTLRYYGANISNHDRLFESPYYSFAPPIDIDKFLNYYQYFWIPSTNNIPAIKISNFSQALIESEIIGQETFNTKARLTVDISGGSIVSVNTVWAGQYYDDGFGFEIAVVETAGGGAGDALITYDVVGGVITNLNIVGPGSGYTDGTSVALLEVPDAVNFSSGFVIEFDSSTSGTYFQTKYTVEGVGRSINLVPQQNQLLPFDQYVFIPWDFNGDFATGTGDPWDFLPWDCELGVSDPDYITIERGACDRNGWSRTNHWYHVDVVNTIANLTGVPIDSREIAKRPIIEFRKDIELFRSGKKFVSEVTLAGTDVSPPTVTPETYNSLTGLNTVTSFNAPVVDYNLIDGDNLIVFTHEMTRAQLTVDVVGGQVTDVSITVPGDSYLPGLSNQTFALTDTANGDGNALIFYDTTVDGQMTNARVAVAGSGYEDGNGINVIETDVPYPTTGQGIYRVVVDSGNNVSLVEEYQSVKDDVVLVTTGENNSGRTFYNDGEKWVEAETQKFGINTPPLYQLYDTDAIKLDNQSAYPGNNFTGSEIFSYKLNDDTTVRDSVLDIPLVFTGLGQISDIVFENDLQTQRFSYLVGNSAVEIPGYYFYNLLNPTTSCEFEGKLSNEWKYFDLSKQRVIDRYIIDDTSVRVYDLSVLPFEEDVIVKLEGIVLDVGVDYTLRNDKITLLRTPIKDQVLEMFTYSREESKETFTIDNISERRYKLSKIPDYNDFSIVGDIQGPITDFTVVDKFIVFGSTVSFTLNEVITVEYISSENLKSSARGYYEIPQSLENNPENVEVTDHSYNDLSQHMLSIISNQEGIGNVALGEKNTYRDSKKDTSRGELILQNTSSLLKAMFVTSNENVNVVESIRFAQQEYERFKNKFVRTVFEMNANNEFATVESLDNSIQLDAWFNEVVSRINQSSGTNTTFNHSYMVALGTVYQEEKLDLASGEIDASGNVTVELSNYEDLTDIKNTLYLFTKKNNTSVLDGQSILLDKVDYEIVSTDIPIRVKINESVSRKVFGTRDEMVQVTLSTAGGNYQIGDVLEFVGGTGVEASVEVTNIDVGGVITSVRIVNSGEYLNLPPEPVTVIGGNGSGAEFNYTTAPKITVDEVYARLYSNPSPASHIPATPSKLGMYQTTRPRIITDTTFPTPLNPNGAGFILGHDGSRTPMVGDIRDTFLLELEKRIYNGISEQFKGDFIPLIKQQDILPGKFRNTNFTLEEVNDIFKASFSKWTNANRKNWRVNDTYDINDEWTYNYTGNGLNETNTPGYWRGIYQYYYDTNTPHLTPWEMLGFTNRPSWWITQYSSDYSSTNIAMWNDLENGIIAQGARAGQYDEFKRPGLVANYLPVDTNANLVSPTTLGLTQYPLIDQDREADWQFGDFAPIEKDWRDTSSYPFALMELYYLTKPARFSELFWDTKETTRAIADPTQIVNISTSQRSRSKDLVVHGETISGDVVVKLGYQQWISDRLTFRRLNITNKLGERIRTLRTKLAHKMAGFTVEQTFDLFSEAISPDSSTNTLLLPKESIDLKLQKGPSIDDYVYSGVVIRRNDENRFQIYGYDLLQCKFTTYQKEANSRAYEINVGGNSAPFREFLSERSYKNGEYVRYNTVFYRANKDLFADRFNQSDWTKVNKLPTIGGFEATYYPDRNKNKKVEYLYGHEFDTVQDVFDFLIGYESYLKDRGWIFDEINPETNVISDFLEGGKQFLSWVSMNFDAESVIVLSPLAAGPKLKVRRGYPDNVERTNNGVYSIQDEQGVVIDPRNTTVIRNDQEIKVIPLQDDVRVYYLRVSASETEHIFTLDNITTFNDVIYDPLMGIRQPRVRMNAVRTKDWIGKFEAPGYLIDGDLKLIPNLENTTESIRRYHDTETRLDVRRVEDTARHLIGYEEKNYLVNLQLDEDVQYQFYQGAIREKGTEASIKKLLRSSFVTSEQDITTYEEWALKLADYGAKCVNQSFDVSIRPSDLKTDPQLIILDTPKTRTGSIKEIIVINSVDKYTTPPAITITKGPGDFGNGGGAIASAVLDDAGFLIRIDVINPGRGYITEPIISITDGGWDIEAWDSLPWDYGTNDKALSVLQKDITPDRENDDIVYIDVDDPERWIRKPRTCGLMNLIPTTTETQFTIPNAGWASIADVDNTLFDVNSFIELFETGSNNAPIIEQRAVYDPVSDTTTWTDGKRQTIYVAKARLGSTQFGDNTDIRSDDWNIYRATDADMSYGESFRLEENVDGTILELDKPAFIPIDQEDRRFIGGTIVINIRRVIQQKPLRTEIVNLAFNVELLDFEGTVYIARYRLYDSSGNVVNLSPDVIELLETDPTYSARIWTYTGMRFDTIKQRDNFQADNGVAGVTFLPGELTWINSNTNGLWEVQELQDNGTEWLTYTINNEVNNRVISTPRIETPQVDTNKFKNGILYGLDDNETIFMLPVYDPYKGILPGISDQNIDFISEVDPARYSFADNDVLVNESTKFGAAQTGRLWWDTSTMRYLNYEQGSNRERRDFWGKLFPGSVINVYEWTRSIVPPSQYDGDGTPRNTTDYALFVEYDSSLNRELNVYYFWVKDKTTVPPNIANRTLSSRSVASFLTNPTARGYRWFAPINSHSNMNAFERKFGSFFVPLQQSAVPIVEGDIANANRYLFTIPYDFFENLEIRIVPGSGNTATPFAPNELLVEDVHYTVNGSTITYNSRLVFPNRGIDPGDQINVTYRVYTETEDRNAFIISNVNNTLSSQETVFQVNYSYLDEDAIEHAEWHIVTEGDEDSVILDQHWNKMVDSLLGQTDIIKWSSDVAGYCPTSGTEGFLLVPDPTLSDAEKCGTSYRPRQTWFDNMIQAREIFVKSINGLLAEISIRDQIPEWEETFGSEGSTVWQWVNWYAEGWSKETAIPSRQVQSVTILEELTGIKDREIIKVLDEDNEDALFTLYVYDLINDQYNVIARESCTVELQDIIYTEAPPQTQRTFELREIINFIESTVFKVDFLINKNKIFFTMLNYSLSEKPDNDWVFKTTYLSIKQSGIEFNQNKFLDLDPVNSITQYVGSVKPYHCKIRDYSTTRSAGTDLAPGQATEIRLVNPTLTFDRVTCNTVGIVKRGEGYAVNDVVTVVGGDAFAPLTARVLEVIYDGNTYRSEQDEFGIDVFGGIVDLIVLEPGEYNTYTTEELTLSGGTGFGATAVVAPNDCLPTGVIRDARSFTTATYPWDAVDWDDCPWDGDMPVNYYTSSDPNLPIAQQFDGITAGLTLPTPELVTNGMFDTDTDWVKGTGWVISAGSAISDGTQTQDSDLSQAVASLQEGNTYEITFTVSGYVSGIVTPVIGDTEGTNRTANGVYTETIVAGPGGTVEIRADLNFVGNVDNVKVRQVAGPTIIVPFTPTANATDMGPYLYLNGKEFFNFTYSSAQNIIILLEDDIPTTNDVLEIFDILPMDGGQFLQPYTEEGIPEELVPLDAHENLVINVKRSVYRCQADTRSHVHWIPDSDVDASTINVFVNGVPLPVSDYKVVGPHLFDGTYDSIIEGDFSTTTAWTQGANWTLLGGEASMVVGGAMTEVDRTLSQSSAAIAAGQEYEVTYTISNWGSGTISPKLGGTTGTASSGNGTYTENITASLNTKTFSLIGDTSFEGTVDDISVRPVPAYGWDPVNTCEGPPWDAELGVLIYIGFAGTEEITITYDKNSGPLPSGFSFMYHMNPQGWQEIYRLCANETSTLNTELNIGDDEIILDTVALPELEGASLNLPKYVWVNGELIGYHRYDDSGPNVILSNLIRGVNGTSPKSTNAVGEEVFAAKQENLMPNFGTWSSTVGGTSDLTASQIDFLSNC